MYQSVGENLAYAIRAQLRKTIMKFTSQCAVTKNSYKSGRGAAETGQLAGLEIPYKTGVVHGETALDPYAGVTSFERMYAPKGNKMYAGLAFTGLSVEVEHFHQKDAMAGNLPEGANEMRDQALQTYLQHHNWYRIGKGDGALGVITAVAGSLLTFASDNLARGRSKGSLRLAVSAFTTAGKRILYQSYNTTTDTLGATFYITSKPSAVGAQVVIVDGGTITAGEIVVKYGHYKRVPYGHAYHFDDSARWYQGANTAVDTFLNARKVDGQYALVTATLMDTAKGSMQTRANNVDARFKRVGHMSIGNYKQLASYGYFLRQSKSNEMTTTGMPVNYEDEDTEFIQDADFEDAYIDIRDRKSYFEYRQSEMTEVSAGLTQYVGINGVGSTEKYRNWGEAYNFVWDGRGDDGKHQQGQGGPNSSTFIANLQIPANNQVAEGISLV